MDDQDQGRGSGDHKQDRNADDNRKSYDASYKGNVIASHEATAPIGSSRPTRGGEDPTEDSSSSSSASGRSADGPGHSGQAHASVSEQAILLEDKDVEKCKYDLDNQDLLGGIELGKLALRHSNSLNGDGELLGAELNPERVPLPSFNSTYGHLCPRVGALGAPPVPPLTAPRVDQRPVISRLSSTRELETIYANTSNVPAIPQKSSKCQSSTNLTDLDQITEFIEEEESLSKSAPVSIVPQTIVRPSPPAANTFGISNSDAIGAVGFETFQLPDMMANNLSTRSESLGTDQTSQAAAMASTSRDAMTENTYTRTSSIETTTHTHGRNVPQAKRKLAQSRGENRSDKFNTNNNAANIEHEAKVDDYDSGMKDTASECRDEDDCDKQPKEAKLEQVVQDQTVGVLEQTEKIKEQISDSGDDVSVGQGNDGCGVEQNACATRRDQIAHGTQSVDDSKPDESDIVQNTSTLEQSRCDEEQNAQNEMTYESSGREQTAEQGIAPAESEPEARGRETDHAVDGASNRRQTRQSTSRRRDTKTKAREPSADDVEPARRETRQSRAANRMGTRSHRATSAEAGDQQRRRTRQSKR